MLEKCKFFCWLDSPFIFPYVRFSQCSAVSSPSVFFGHLKLKIKLHLLLECKEISTKLITFSQISTSPYIFMVWFLIKHRHIYLISYVYLYCGTNMSHAWPQKIPLKATIHVGICTCLRLNVYTQQVVLTY